MMAILPPTSPTTLIGGLAFGRNPSKRKKKTSAWNKRAAISQMQLTTYFLIITLQKKFSLVTQTFPMAHWCCDLSLLSPIMDVCTSQTPCQHFAPNHFLEHNEEMKSFAYLRKKKHGTLAKVASQYFLHDNFLKFYNSHCMACWQRIDIEPEVSCCWKGGGKMAHTW